MSPENQGVFQLQKEMALQGILVFVLQLVGRMTCEINRVRFVQEV